MNKKITFALAGAILMGLITAVTVFLAIFIGYWLVMITAFIGASVGLTMLKEREENSEIPEDWYQDVGTKH